MVGGGFRHGLYDVAALAAGFHNGRALTVTDLLSGYEEDRLRSAQAHVERSQAASAQYLERQNRRP
jgi:hypothetical protein